MRKLLWLCTLMALLSLAALGCTGTATSTQPEEAGHDPVWESIAPKAELVSSLELDTSQSTPEAIVLHFKYLDNTGNKVTFSDADGGVVIEIDEMVQGEEENKDSWYPKKKVLSSRQAKPMAITNSADWVSIPMHYLDLEGVNRDNLQIRVHVKASPPSIDVITEAPLKLPE